MNQLQRFYNWIATSPSLFALTPPFESTQTLSLNPLTDTDYQGNPRLGFLYQHLCTQLLVNSGKYTVELEEVQLNRDNGQTLGAIDLILNNQETEQYEHWEVAIKFYLLHQGVWFGPNAHDQLDKKLQRMLSHQLKMSSSAPFYAQHPKLDKVSEHLLLQGRLYINPFSPETIPTHCLGYEINPDRVNGYWCYESQWELIQDPLFQLDKPYWATGLSDFNQPISRPNGRFVHAQTQHGQFWFVVPDSWPNN